MNTSRKWALVGITSLFFAIAITLAVLSMMVVIPTTQQGVAVDMPGSTPGVATGRAIPVKLLWVTLAVQLFFVACGTIAVILHVSRMTRAILRAIESVRK